MQFSNLTAAPQRPKMNESNRVVTEPLPIMMMKLKPAKIEWNSRIFCLLYLTIASEAFSSTATFYVPDLALNHFHLELIYVKLLFLNCTLFTLLVFILFSLALDYFDERKLFLVALSLQIAAFLVLTSIGFTWNHITSAQNYMLLLYICLGMPIFAYPFSNSILSNITDARNASFYQGVSYAALQSGILYKMNVPCIRSITLQ
jgi:MFS family permease